MNLVFFGGSITWGAGATCYEKSWASLVTEYLRHRLAPAELKVFNAAISGTGTAFGVFRLGQHVLPLEPDLIFVEFAVNDSAAAMLDRSQVLATLDYIIRTLLIANPQIRIVLLYSAMKDWFACAAVHEEIARRFNILSIDLQSHFRSLVESSRYTWEQLMVDDVHPSDLGHEIYAQHLIGSLERDWPAIVRPQQLSPLVTSFRFFRPRIVGFEGVRLYGAWTQRRVDDKYKHLDFMRVPSMLYSDVPGNVLEWDFEALHFGLYHLLDRNCGICRIQIDDEPPIMQDFFYPTDGEFLSFVSRFGCSTKPHRLTVEVTSEKNEGSGAVGFGLAGLLMD